MLLQQHLLRFMPDMDSHAATCAQLFALLRQLVKQPVSPGHWTALAAHLSAQLRVLPTRRACGRRAQQREPGAAAAAHMTAA